MPYHTILEKMDNAIEAFIEAQRGNSLDGVLIFKGFSTLEIEEECITVVSTEGVPEEGAEDSGNYTVKTTIGYRSLMESGGGPKHSEKWGIVSDMFRNDTTAAALMNVPQLTVMVATPGNTRRRVDGNAYVTEEEWEFFVAPSKPANS